MPVKEFDGWTPEWVTEYEYDAAGRLVRSVTRMAEPRWDERSQAEILALGRYRSLVHECGGYLPDTTAPDADERYKADEPVRCHLCTARYAAQAAHLDGPHSPHPQALMWPVRRR